MRSKWLIPGLTALGVAGIAGVALAAGGDDDEDPTGPKTVDPVVPPQGPAEVQASKTAICTCYRGGAQDGAELLRCALGQVYPETDWVAVMDMDARAVPPTTAQTVNTFATWVGEFLQLTTDDARQMWCNAEDPVEPGPPPQPPKPKPNPGGAAPPYPYDVDAMRSMENSAATAAYAQHQAMGNVGPFSNAVLNTLADQAYVEVYSNGPFPIGGNTGGWKPWAEAWLRIKADLVTLNGG